MPRSFDDVSECVEAILARLGRDIVLALPLGIGKPNPLANEFYRRAKRDSSIKLKIFTALSLATPGWRGDLERRFIEPMVQRVFGNTLALDYVRDLHAGEVPGNIEIAEFFLDPGAFLGATHSQRHYHSANYTHVARDLVDSGVNVIGQLVARSSVDGRTQYSFGSNPDVTVDLLRRLIPVRQKGRDVVLVGEVHRQMPFMFGSGVLEADAFDYIIDHPRYDYDLFAPPNLPLSTADYGIGLYCASLVRDGGTLQLGIGELGDAIVYCLQLRHQQNAEFREILGILNSPARFGERLSKIGGDAPFAVGLYACSEMFIDGFLDLYRSGVLKRRVYGDLHVQRLLSEGRVAERIDAAFLAALAPCFAGGITQGEFQSLQEAGVFRRDCHFESGAIVNAEGARVKTDLGTAESRRDLLEHCTARELSGGVLLHGGFFLGPRGFYAALRDMPEAERRQFVMCGVEFINQIDGAEQMLKIAQRRAGRFINSTMMVTLLGDAVSDALADGRVVSGVGGQYNFVAMGHALEDARSILAVRSTRTKNSVTTSNIVWNYAHTTIPRHLRDIVVTEYGVADLRGKSDEDVIKALLDICDSQFQPDLLRQAKAAGKLDPDYEIPDMNRNNTARILQERFALVRARGLFSEFPFGSDFTSEEIVLSKALRKLEQRTHGTGSKVKAFLAAALQWDTPDRCRPYLERMGLAAPKTRQEWLWQRLLVRELKDGL